MIGRTEDLKPFDTIRWAREQASTHSLKTLEAHVLLLLATYANRAGVAWPSIKTLALDSGLRPTKDGRCSAVSAAMQRLQDLQLVWTVQGGNGRSARRELLFNPAAQPSRIQDGCDTVQRPLMNPQPEPQPSRDQEGCAPDETPQPSGSQDTAFLGSGPEVPVNGQGTASTAKNELPESSLPATRKAGRPDLGMAEEDQLSVRRQIAESLAHADQARKVA